MISKKEVLKYLRTSSTVEDESLSRLIEKYTRLAYEIKPKTIFEIFPIEITGDSVKIAEIEFKSSRLAQNLNGCKKTVVFAATLGTEADTLLRKAQAEGTADVMVCQGVLAARIEEVCDSLEEEIKASHGVKLRSRYSPGYYDLKLESQKDFFKLIDITKRIGVTLSENMLMIPSKSVTAFIGIENEN